MGGSAGGQGRCRGLGLGGCAGCWAVTAGSVIGMQFREYPPLGSGRSATGRGVRRVMLCGARGSRGAAGWGVVGAASVRALTLVGWREGVCVWGGAWGDVPKAPSFSPRPPKGLPQASENIRVVLGCGVFVASDSLGMERIGQHGFRCGLRHPSNRPRFSAEPQLGQQTRPSREGSARAHFSQLPELRLRAALPPLSMGGAVALGGCVVVGVGVCAGVMGTGGGGGPRGGSS